jgi:DNA modification methylase
MPDASVDAVVTDPPYGLSFMGKRWDYDVPSEDVWRECLRVLKPGGHLLAFAGTRTQHRMAVRIEDAGFEIRDMIAWVYGSGFPKSLDVSKAIDKCNGEPNRLLRFTAWMRTTGLKAKAIDDTLKAAGMISQTSNFAVHYFNDGQPAIPTAAMWQHVRPLCDDVPAWVDELVERIEAEREVVGQGYRVDKKTSAVPISGATPDGHYDITAPATEAARQWAGWGTALKPALEPITVARKPLVATVAANVLEHGTGGLNVDGCRVGTGDDRTPGGATGKRIDPQGGYSGGWGFAPNGVSRATGGRWPANLIHDGSDEVVGLFPVTGASKAAPRGGTNPNPMDWGNGRADGNITKGHDDNGGSAARFFYCAKASKADRDEGNGHPTVKPTDLMRYLCRLVTPPGGLVLDPFTGSGSTGKAAIREGFRFVGIEREAEYVEIARARIAAAKPDQLSLL